MELRDSLALFSRRRGLGMAVILLVMVAAYLWSYLQPTSYITSISFAVNRVNKEETVDYQYDGYYALQASDLFSETVVSWLQTPSVLVEIYERAGLTNASNASIRSLTSRFKTKKAAAQNIVVSYSSPTSEEASKLATAMTETITDHTATANRTAQDKALFEVQAARPVIVKVEANPILVGLASLIVGIALAAFLVPLVEYLSAAPRQSP